MKLSKYIVLLLISTSAYADFSWQLSKENGSWSVTNPHNVSSFTQTADGFDLVLDGTLSTSTSLCVARPSPALKDFLVKTTAECQSQEIIVHLKRGPNAVSPDDIEDGYISVTIGYDQGGTTSQDQGGSIKKAQPMERKTPSEGRNKW